MSVNKMGDLQTSTYENDLKPVVQFNEPIHFTNSFHAVKLLEDLQSLRNHKELCDITLKTDNGTIVVGHKNVLVAASKYFRDMFSSVDKNNNVVIIKNLDSSALQILIDYIYTGKIKVTNEDVKVLLPAAKILQLDYVRRACVEYLQTHINSSNCLSIKTFADLHKCTELRSCSEVFIKKNFLEMVKYDEFISLTCEQIIELISYNDIAVPSEVKIFECVINWIKHDLNTREKYLPQLMEHVRLPLLASTPRILKNIIEEPLLKNCPIYNDIISEALHFLLLKSFQYITIPQTIRCKPRQFGSSKKIILLFECSNKLIKYRTEWYDPETNLCKNAAVMKDYHLDFGIGVVRDQFVIAMGGVINSVHSQSVSMLDVSLLSPCWVPIADMLVHRTNLGVGVLNDCIYAIGGYDGADNLLSSVEVFDISIQKWRMVAEMTTKRGNLGVGVLNNLLYAVGGCDGYNDLKSVECYYSILDIWTPVADMTVRRNGVSVGVLNGAIYAIGGYDGGSDGGSDGGNDDNSDGHNNNDHSSYIRSVEIYRPSDGLWSSIADMNLGRYKPGVVALDGLLYVLGGDEESNYSTMEVYDPNTNVWSMKNLSKNSKDFQIFSGVVVNRPPNFTK
ncbi:kelch-like protein 2 [Rhopalosiphum padi]|uniref:kelch-like protein 2 n=1 Tax=Rhopalosiphum padi TaxID=40932 RepID=UPI00298D764D|nr:kelch-like protein 2 [Rhopalosiphum padi]XP_060847847.1 kelch-like protein 2 [Rhopalosiphum padi]